METFLTYEDLFQFLSKLTPEQRQQTATVWEFGMDEFLPVNELRFTDSTCDVLDPGHVVMVAG